jgi:GTP:adenosylcobinamide-phosphate guanylyltransferase
MAEGWTALILAGQRPGIDPLAAHFGCAWKALVPIAGEAMLTHVVRTLRSTHNVARIIILAQDPSAMAAAAEAGGGVDAILPSESSISLSIAAVIGGANAPWPVLVTTADHPLLSPAIVAQFLHDAQGADISVGLVEKQNLLSAFPGNKRTWLKFSDGHWSGANLFALTSSGALPVVNFWAKAEQDRKIAYRLFRHFGPWLMLRALTRTIGLAAGLRKAGARMGASVQMVVMDNPVAAIDVDKVADHALAEALLMDKN